MKLLLGIEITTLFLGIKSFGNKNNIIDDIKLLDNKSNNLFAIMVKGSDGNYNEASTFPEGAYILNETMSSCVDNNGNKIDNVLSYSDGFVSATTNKTVYCYLYFDKDKSVYAKLLDDYENNNGVKKTTDENGKDVYYYTGNITNNNLVFNNYCWKMVRTTETDGVKLLYNGELKQVIEAEPITQDKYNITTNTPTGTPFTFDDSTKKWTSGIAGVNSGENTIEFTVTEAGDYVLNYEVSSEVNWDKSSFYKNGTGLKVDLSGISSGSIELNGLTASDVIKVVYKKDSSGNKNDDVVRFSIGTPTGNVTTNCNNTGADVFVNSKTEFNKSCESLATVGYMYGADYVWSGKSFSSFETYYYGSDVTWNGTTYTLSNIENSSTVSDVYYNNNKHYTCLSTSSSCSTVYYIYGLNSSSKFAYYISLANGKKIEDALDEMLNYNTTNSTIKTVIDKWFSTSMINVTDCLENAIYCNNRNISHLGGWDSSEKDDGWPLKFNDFSNPRLTCQDKEDQFTLKVDSGGTLGYGNNTLDYPVGLLTLKEASLAFGDSTANYLNNGASFWLMSPSYYAYEYENVMFSNNGKFNHEIVNNLLGVRPAISLKKTIKITGGTGEIEDPYTVSLN